MYERMKIQDETDKKDDVVNWSPFRSSSGEENMVVNPGMDFGFSKVEMPSIGGKPWFVVATKADLEGTRENYEGLKKYLERVEKGEDVHPSGQENGWCKRLEAIPVSAINGHGVERITEWTVGLLDD